MAKEACCLDGNPRGRLSARNRRKEEEAPGIGEKRMACMQRGEERKRAPNVVSAPAGSVQLPAERQPVSGFLKFQDSRAQWWQVHPRGIEGVLQRAGAALGRKCEKGV